MRLLKATAAQVMLLVALTSGVPSIALAHAQPDYEAPRLEEGLELEERFRLEALSAAFKHARSVSFDTKGKVVILSQNGNQLVVRFEPQRARMYDGSAQFTYDPTQGKIVGVSIDG